MSLMALPQRLTASQSETLVDRVDAVTVTVGDSDDMIYSELEAMADAIQFERNIRTAQKRTSAMALCVADSEDQNQVIGSLSLTAAPIMAMKSCRLTQSAATVALSVHQSETLVIDNHKSDSHDEGSGATQSQTGSTASCRLTESDCHSVNGSGSDCAVSELQGVQLRTSEPQAVPAAAACDTLNGIGNASISTPGPIIEFLIDDTVTVTEILSESTSTSHGRSGTIPLSVSKTRPSDSPPASGFESLSTAATVTTTSTQPDSDTVPLPVTVGQPEAVQPEGLAQPDSEFEADKHSEKFPSSIQQLLSTKLNDSHSMKVVLIQKNTVTASEKQAATSQCHDDRGAQDTVSTAAVTVSRLESNAVLATVAAVTDSVDSEAQLAFLTLLAYLCHCLKRHKEGVVTLLCIAAASLRRHCDAVQKDFTIAQTVTTPAGPDAAAVSYSNCKEKEQLLMQHIAEVAGKHSAIYAFMHHQLLAVLKVPQRLVTSDALLIQSVLPPASQSETESAPTVTPMACQTAAAATPSVTQSDSVTVAAELGSQTDTHTVNDSLTQLHHATNVMEVNMTKAKSPQELCAAVVQWLLAFPLNVSLTQSGSGSHCGMLLVQRRAAFASQFLHAFTKRAFRMKTIQARGESFISNSAAAQPAIITLDPPVQTDSWTSSSSGTLSGTPACGPGAKLQSDLAVPLSGSLTRAATATLSLSAAPSAAQPGSHCAASDRAARLTSVTASCEPSQAVSESDLEGQPAAQRLQPSFSVTAAIIPLSPPRLKGWSSVDKPLWEQTVTNFGLHGVSLEALQSALSPSATWPVWAQQNEHVPGLLRQLVNGFFNGTASDCVDALQQLYRAECKYARQQKEEERKRKDEEDRQRKVLDCKTSSKKAVQALEKQVRAEKAEQLKSERLCTELSKIKEQLTEMKKEKSQLKKNNDRLKQLRRNAELEKEKREEEVKAKDRQLQQLQQQFKEKEKALQHRLLQAQKKKEILKEKEKEDVIEEKKRKKKAKHDGVTDGIVSQTLTNRESLTSSAQQPAPVTSCFELGTQTAAAAVSQNGTGGSKGVRPPLIALTRAQMRAEVAEQFAVFQEAAMKYCAANFRKYTVKSVTKTYFQSRLLPKMKEKGVVGLEDDMALIFSASAAPAQTQSGRSRTPSATVIQPDNATVTVSTFVQHTNKRRKLVTHDCQDSEPTTDSQTVDTVKAAGATPSSPIVAQSGTASSITDRLNATQLADTVVARLLQAGWTKPELSNKTASAAAALASDSVENQSHSAVVGIAIGKEKGGWLPLSQTNSGPAGPGRNSASTSDANCNNNSDRSSSHGSVAAAKRGRSSPLTAAAKKSRDCSPGHDGLTRLVSDCADGIADAESDELQATVHAVPTAADRSSFYAHRQRNSPAAAAALPREAQRRIQFAHRDGNGYRNAYQQSNSGYIKQVRTRFQADSEPHIQLMDSDETDFDSMEIQPGSIEDPRGTEGEHDMVLFSVPQRAIVTQSGRTKSLIGPGSEQSVPVGQPRLLALPPNLKHRRSMTYNDGQALSGLAGPPGDAEGQRLAAMYATAYTTFAANAAATAAAAPGPAHAMASSCFVPVPVARHSISAFVPPAAALMPQPAHVLELRNPMDGVSVSPASSALPYSTYSNYQFKPH